MKIKGLRSRVTIGFMGIAGLLFLSGMLSFFELNHLSDDTEIILRSNKRNMELSQGMIHALQAQNFAFVQIVAFGDRTLDESCLQSVEELAEAIDNAREGAPMVELIDSLAYTTQQLKRVTQRLVALPQPSAIDSLMVTTELLEPMQIDSGRDIYNDYQPIYNSMLSLIDEYLNVSQDVLAPRAESLRYNAYRAVTPVFISLVVMIVIVLLLYYFMLLYCVNPIVAMNKSLIAFLNYKIPFTPKAECRDEVRELRDNIEQLITITRKQKQ